MSLNDLMCCIHYMVLHQLYFHQSSCHFYPCREAQQFVDTFEGALGKGKGRKLYAYKVMMTKVIQKVFNEKAHLPHNLEMLAAVCIMFSTLYVLLSDSEFKKINHNHEKPINSNLSDTLS